MNTAPLNNTSPIIEISDDSEDEYQNENANVFINNHKCDKHGYRTYTTDNNRCLYEEDIPPKPILRYFTQTTNEMLLRNYRLQKQNAKIVKKLRILPK